MLRTTLNRTLDQIVRTRIPLFGRPLGAFHVALFGGAATGSALVLILAAYRGLSLTTTTAVIVTAILTFLAHAMLAKVITGDENMVHYRHLLLVIVVAAVMLWSTRQPVLPYLDLLVLGLGLLGVCGRVGCLMVGCCYGRPHRWGVRYRAGHVEEGFPSYLAGVRLFPVQLVESVWLLAVVGIGAALVVNHHLPGTTLTWYLVAYATGRFGFEFLRGDAVRHYFLSFSEAQWTSLLVLSAVVAFEASGLLPFFVWPSVATILVGGIMLVTSSTRRSHQARLAHPQNLKEIADALEFATAQASDRASLVRHNSHPPVIRVAHTSSGLQISASRFSDAAGQVYHYAVSSTLGTLSEATAKSLAEMILLLKYPSSSVELIAGQHGVFHFLIHQM